MSRVVLRILSVACLCGIKPTWSFSMWEFITGFRRDARTLARSIMLIFSVNIGLKLEQEEWSLSGFDTMEITAVSISE